MTTTTPLRRRKSEAYGVTAPTEQLEDRVAHLQASPYAVAYDRNANRLLYHRGDWHYRVRAETEEIVDYGRVDTVICALPADQMPLTDVTQGEVLALVASEPVTADPGWGGPRIVEMIAADPVSGNFAVYSHREDQAEVPYETDLRSFEGGTGSLLSFAPLFSPADETPLWHVPHAIAHDGWLYAIERDATAWPDPGPATGRVVRRSLGNLGTLSSFMALPEGERHVYPHSLAFDPETEILFVLSSRLNNPETFTAHSTSILTTVDAPTMAPLTAAPVSFGFFEYSGTARPYFLGAWEAAGGPNTGGFLWCEGGSLIASGIDPSTFDPLPWASRQWAVFRWLPTGEGIHQETLGPALPGPMFRTGSGLLGAYQSSLPPEELSL